MALANMLKIIQACRVRALYIVLQYDFANLMSTSPGSYWPRCQHTFTTSCLSVTLRERHENEYLTSLNSWMTLFVFLDPFDTIVMHSVSVAAHLSPTKSPSGNRIEPTYRPLYWACTVAASGSYPSSLFALSTSSLLRGRKQLQKKLQ